MLSICNKKVLPATIRAIVGLLLVTLAACGGKSANCEFDADGATVCIDGMGNEAFCRGDIGGEPTPAFASDQDGCADLGYAVECSGVLTVGDSVAGVEYSNWNASSEEDCLVSDGFDLQF